MCCTQSGVLASRPIGGELGSSKKASTLPLPASRNRCMYGSGAWVRRHLVLGDGEHEVHAQVLAVPLHRVLGVAAAVGDVVDAFDLHGAPVGQVLASSGFPHFDVALGGPDARVAGTAWPRRRRASRRTACSGRRSPSGRTCGFSAA